MLFKKFLNLNVFIGGNLVFLVGLVFYCFLFVILVMLLSMLFFVEVVLLVNGMD